MGVFSWKCAVSGKPILNDMTNDIYSKKFSRVTIIRKGTKGPSEETGIYDGYGRVRTEAGEVDVCDDVKNGTIKLALTAFYKGQSFASLRANERDPGQGHFHSEASLKKMFGEDT